MAFRIKIEGLAELKKKLRDIPETVKTEMDALMNEAANDFVNRAIDDAPRDEGVLIQGISAKKTGEMEYEIVSAAPYSAYIEFGTRSRVEIPADLKTYAAQFKGGGNGDYYDFLNNILDWVKRKGIASRYSVKTRKALKHTKSDDERMLDIAQAIANSILRNGIKAHPFFFKQRGPVMDELTKKAGAILKKANSK